LNECGLSYIWQNEQLINVTWFTNKVFNILHDQFKQSWTNDMYNSSKCINCRIFKNIISMEKYLLNLPERYWKLLCKFRTGNTRLPMETGRWRYIPRENRLCNLCNGNEIRDEFHYLFNCTDIIFKQARQTCVTKFYYTSKHLQI
jgi:hypothetical protein